MSEAWCSYCGTKIVPPLPDSYTEVVIGTTRFESVAGQRREVLFRFGPRAVSHLCPPEQDAPRPPEPPRPLPDATPPTVGGQL